MLVSHRKRFIYMKTMKTASTSVESYFEPYCMPAGTWTLCHGRPQHVSEAGIIGHRGPNEPPVMAWWSHMPAAHIRNALGRELWDAYSKFCVIRNPYDKVLSHFYHLRTKRRIEVVESDHDAAQFEAWLLTHGPMVDRHVYMIDGQVCADHLLRYETLQHDLAELCARLQVDWDPAALPTWKSGLRPATGTVAQVYTATSKNIVRDAYAFELEAFGYRFEG